MEKSELKDVLHLYIGCYIKSELMGVQHKFTDFNKSTIHHFIIGNFKLILRPLSDMTEEETKEYETLFGCNPHESDEWYCEIIMQDIGKPKVWLWLLKRGFDLFGLIESGQAIKATE